MASKPREPLVVSGQTFAAIAGRWAKPIDDLATASAQSNGSYQRMPTILSASALLASSTGYDESAMRRRIQGRQEVVPLGLVDAMLRCMGQEHALNDGRLPVYRNPYISEERYREFMVAAGADPDEYDPYPKRWSQKTGWHADFWQALASYLRSQKGGWQTNGTA